MNPPVAVVLSILGCLALSASAGLRVGTAVYDITPTNFPVLVSGGVLSRTADKVNTPLHVRALTLDDGKERIAVAVVDTCMMSRELLDAVKQLAASRSKLRPDRILIAATHCHSAPACTGALGTDADSAYVPFLKERLVEALVASQSNLVPARVGWASIDAGAYTAVRRWILRPDRMQQDPFGESTVRAAMHAAKNLDQVTGPSGPEDPELGLIAFQTLDGQPLAVLAAFSMHYYSDRPISADYFGLFCEGLKQRLAPGSPSFAALLAHGCSGDIWLRDYSQAPEERSSWTIESYTEGLLDLAEKALASCEYRDDADLAMAEQRLRLSYRVPDNERLAWARRLVEAMPESKPSNKTEVYAQEQLILHERQETEVVVQALRIGDLALATTPTETYALTGLKIKRLSPVAHTLVLDLANGGDGYIPPPEQHVLGGYNTWPARSAGLETQAEPKITEAALNLLEQVAGRPRRSFQPTDGSAAKALMKARPAAYWRMNEFGGPTALDSSGNNHHGRYEPGVVFYLPGPQSDAFSGTGDQNRCPHFAGGRMLAEVPGLGDRYTVSLWLWNGLPVDAREVTGWLFACRGLQLGLAGTRDEPGRLLMTSINAAGERTEVVGRTILDRWTWHQVVLVREKMTVRVYLDDAAEPEIELHASGTEGAGTNLVFGGVFDPGSSWEGCLDEIAVFDRALTGNEVKTISARASEPPPNIILILCDNLG